MAPREVTLNDPLLGLMVLALKLATPDTVEPPMTCRPALPNPELPTDTERLPKLAESSATAPLAWMLRAPDPRLSGLPPVWVTAPAPRWLVRTESPPLDALKLMSLSVMSPAVVVKLDVPPANCAAAAVVQLASVKLLPSLVALYWMPLDATRAIPPAPTPAGLALTVRFARLRLPLLTLYCPAALMLSKVLAAVTGLVGVAPEPIQVPAPVLVSETEFPATSSGLPKVSVPMRLAEMFTDPDPAAVTSTPGASLIAPTVPLLAVRLTLPALLEMLLTLMPPEEELTLTLPAVDRLLMVAPAGAVTLTLSRLPVTVPRVTVPASDRKVVAFAWLPAARA